MKSTLRDMLAIAKPSTAEGVTPVRPIESRDLVERFSDKSLRGRPPGQVSFRVCSPAEVLDTATDELTAGDSIVLGMTQRSRMAAAGQPGEATPHVNIHAHATFRKFKRQSNVTGDPEVNTPFSTLRHRLGKI